MGFLDQLRPGRPGLSRRAFLKASGGATAGLIVGFALPPTDAAAAVAADVAEAASFNPFVRIAPDGRVSVLVKHLDKGQGTLSALTTLVAEELDADWDAMSPEFAPSNPKHYNNLLFGEMQGTGGSTGVPNRWRKILWGRLAGSRVV